ncbi:restriction endonuclease [Streptomyces sp. DASNCL29]|uniref:restriction endonuclease n=1 Tax=Streptomyces sp. DASNCL29 TaxID=2583819 RepID=UPI00110F6CAC|nr:restriction endonuclease [Streptomyces sp. DASNCL29]TMU99957.1 restriction endonuclease [Streptomyces sp. DASNCL29]
MTSTRTILHDPQGRLEAELPLDRETHQRLAAAVLGWDGDPVLHEGEYQQIALQLTVAARAVADDVRRTADQLPVDDPARVLAEDVLEESRRRLSRSLQGTARCAQDRARLVRALYGRLDRLTEKMDSPEPSPAALRPRLPPEGDC